MYARNVLESQQSDHAVHAAVAGRSAAGCWKLTPGRALSLHPREHSVLEIAQGRVWVTVRGSPLAGAPGRDSDQVLQAGDRISVAAGQHLVMEAWSLPGSGPAQGVAFCWEGAAVTAKAVAAAHLPAAQSTPEWECGVVQPCAICCRRWPRAGALWRLLRGRCCTPAAAWCGAPPVLLSFG